MGNITSCHTKAATGGCLRHNRRQTQLANVDSSKTHLNESWESDSIRSIQKGGKGKSIEQLKKEARRLYQQKVGQKAQDNSAFIRESVVVIRESTTMEQIQQFAKAMKEKYGVQCLGIWIHRDEGYHGNSLIEYDTEWRPNLHAHILWDWQNHKTGKSLRLGRAAMRDMQDLAAKATGMQRGTPSHKRHIEGHTYAHEKEEERTWKLALAIAEYENEVQYNENTIIKQEQEKKQLEAEIQKIQKQRDDAKKEYNAIMVQLQELKNKGISTKTLAKLEEDFKKVQKSVNAQTTQLTKLLEQCHDLEDKEAAVERKEKMLQDAYDQRQAILSQIKAAEETLYAVKAETIDYAKSGLYSTQNEAEMAKIIKDYNSDLAKIGQIIAQRDPELHVALCNVSTVYNRAQLDLHNHPAQNNPSIPRPLTHEAVAATPYYHIASVMWPVSPAIHDEPIRKRKNDDEEERKGPKR